MRLSPLLLMFAFTACEGATKNDAAAAPKAPVSDLLPPPPAEGAAGAPVDNDMPADTVIATWDGGQITYGDIASSISNDMVKAKVEYLSTKYSTQNDALENLLLEKLLDAEAKKRGMADASALIEAEVKSKVADPTPAEVEAFYPQVARQLRNAPLEQVRDQVTGALRQRKEKERFFAYVDELKTAHAVANTLPFPDLPRFDVSVDDDPMLGNKDAKVTIVQFAEFQCPYCGKARDSVDQVMKNYEGKVRMVFRDFPLSFHPRAIPAAIAANCAEKQGKYWEVHNDMMSNQRALEESDLTGYATKAGLNLDKWNACRQDPAIAAEVQADVAAGSALGVTGTPAFFINGIMLSGAQPYEQFKTIVDRELAGS